MTNLKSRFVAAGAAVVATLLTFSAASPVHAEPVKVLVHYADLDVGTPAGLSKLRARIHHAARLACESDDPSSRIREAACRQTAVKGAEAQLAQVQEAKLRLASR